MLASTPGVRLPACALRLDKMTDNQKAELLATEKGKLPELTDPVEITKAQITISNVLLDFVSGAAVDRDVAGMNNFCRSMSSAFRPPGMLWWVRGAIPLSGSRL